MLSIVRMLHSSLFLYQIDPKVLHAAAAILLAAAIHSKSRKAIDLTSDPYSTTWQRAILTLKMNKVQLQASLRAVELLESCLEKLKDTNGSLEGKVFFSP